MSDSHEHFVKEAKAAMLALDRIATAAGYGSNPDPADPAAALAEINGIIFAWSYGPLHPGGEFA